MAKDRRGRRPPQRERRRTMETLSDAPIKVAIATTPQSARDGGRTLDQDTELAKAALLYANEVEIVSLGVSLFDAFRQVLDAGQFAGFDLIASLDDETISFIRGQSGKSTHSHRTGGRPSKPRSRSSLRHWRRWGSTAQRSCRSSTTSRQSRRRP